MNLTISVGIDFGTSTTKIAYQVHGQKYVEPVYFGHGLNSPYYPEYCLPSLASFSPKGKLLLGVEAAQQVRGKHYHAGIHRIKMLLAGKYAEDFRDVKAENRYKKLCKKEWRRGEVLSIDVLTVFYLVYAMRMAKRSILRKFSEQDYNVKFIFWVGMPIHHFQMANVKTAFERILVAAQAFEKKYASDIQKDLPPLERQVGPVERLLEKARYDETADSTRVFLTPETIAQVKSYRFSSARVGGLHALVDIGAGTTDICIFYLKNVRKRDEIIDCYAWLNIAFGAGRVEDLIATTIRSKTSKNIERIFETLSSIDSKSNVGLKVRNLLYELWSSTAPVWGGAYRFANESMGFSQIDWYKDAVTILLCGGGSRMKSVYEICERSHLTVQESRDWGPHPVESLPVPRDQYGDNAPFWRMAVAFGLALVDQPKFNLEPDPVAEVSSTKSRAVSTGDFDGGRLIPKPGWV